MNAACQKRSESCQLTVKELLTEWFQNIQHKIKESTASNYRMKAEKHIIPFFGVIQADRLTSDKVYTFIKAKQDDGLSNRYISDILIVLKSVYKYGVHTYHIDNSLKGISISKKKSPEIKLLNTTEQQTLQQYIFKNPNRATLGVALSIATGIRIGELCTLQWKDIDLEKRILTVKKTMQRISLVNGVRKTKLIITDPKSESSKRSIPIPECIIDLLQKFFGEPEEYVVSGKAKAAEPRTVQYRFARILKNVNLPSVHFHALRHHYPTKRKSYYFAIVNHEIVKM